MNKELLTYRIMCGYIRTKINISGKFTDILICSPTIHDMYEAEFIYENKYNELISEDIQTQEQVLYEMCDRGQWSLEKEKRLAEIPKQLEELKIELFNNAFKTSTKNVLKKKIAELKKEYLNLHTEQNKYSYLTAEGIANIEKAYFLASRCAKLPNFSSFIIDLDDPTDTVETIINIRTKNKIEEEDYRLIARNEPWHSYYVCGDVFGLPTSKLTEEQKNLMLYSKMYENVYQSPECPPDYVIEDDDCLDGWFLVQRRKREDAKNGQLGESQISDKVAKHENIFLPAETIEDAKRIESMNDSVARMIKRQRSAVINNAGGVLEHNKLPEEKIKIMEKINGT